MSESELRFETLYREEADRLWRAVFAFAHDREIASDAVSEAFAQCIRGGDAVRSPRDWVWKAAFRIAAGELQERQRWRSLTADPDSVSPVPEASARLLDAIARLSPHQRAAFLLRHIGGYDAGSIGDILGCGASTARVHVFRARRRLQHELEARDEP